MKTFKHKFFGWLEADAYVYVNADGTDGGIVACDATIGASVKITATASIGDGDWFIAVGPQGSRNAMLTAVASAGHGLRWWVGCKQGISTDDLRELVKDTHSNNDHAADYIAVINFVESHPGLARWRVSQNAVVMMTA